MTASTRVPTFFIPHGGGPCFFMDWPGQPHMWDRMGDFLKNMHQTVGARPKAIVIISGHWIEDQFTVTSGEQPSLIYDYHGFPPHTYELTYPALGAPVLAQRIVDLLTVAGIPAGQDSQRGFDHGVFIPFKLIYPNADIPMVQLSMKKGLDPAEHLRAGQALQTLRDEGVLIVGSGMSFHNMRGYNAAFTEASIRFDDWLTNALEAPTAEQRHALLTEWEKAPDARQTQPHPDHLLPLMVAAGAAGQDIGRKIFEDKVMDVIVSGYAFGETPPN
jgi:aromatic ring-opening dioxygenase catalytic subunit (LigB family)